MALVRRLLELELDAVQRIARRTAVELEQHPVQLTRAAPPLGPVVELPELPPSRRAGDEPRRSSANAVVDPREDAQRLVVADEAGRAGAARQIGTQRCMTREARESSRPGWRGRSRSARRSSPRRPRAQRPAPRARATSASCARIIRSRIPRRRCVGSTPTTVTPAQGSCPPGIRSARTGRRRHRRRSRLRRTRRACARPEADGRTAPRPRSIDAPPK